MPTTCSHFRHLQDRLDALCNKFLDAEINAELANPVIFSPDLDNLAAFRLLLHAEVETFLEDKAKEKLRQLEKDIGRGIWHRANPQLISLYVLVRSFIDKQEEVEDEDLKKQFVRVIGAARSRIKANNGIKAPAFAFLSVAAGKPLDEIDSTLSAMLNSYGKDRGEVAHGSATRAHSLVAPSAEKSAAQTIVAQLATYFDVMA